VLVSGRVQSGRAAADTGRLDASRQAARLLGGHTP
jgi:hypothetical protein